MGNDSISQNNGAISVNQDYETIIHAISHRNLIAVTEEGHFKEVGYLGRMWRLLINLGDKKKAFEDCQVARVGVKIEEFVKKNKELITEHQKIEIINKLNSLYKRLQLKNYYSYNIYESINVIKKEFWDALN
jgi:hypothetical protein